MASGCSSPRDGRGGLRPDRADRPSQPNPKARQIIERLRTTGADIAVECGNIAEPDTADRLVSAATATGLPVRGVLHAAAVVEDATLTNITDELIDRDWAPKVYGSWHLHRPRADSRWTGSACSPRGAALLGSPGQGAYAAANSWLDAFAHWRRAQGLPASAIAWGLGRGRPRHVLGRRRRNHDHSRRRRVRVRDTAAP